MQKQIKKSSRNKLRRFSNEQSKYKDSQNFITSNIT